MTFRKNIAASIAALGLLGALGLADVVQARSQTGTARDAVLAFDEDRYRVFLEAGEPMIVMVSGDGDTDLDLRVIDPRGRVIASDLDLTDQCMVFFTPRHTGWHVIAIENLGHVYNEYQLVVQ